jgi:hypothetical protein
MGSENAHGYAQNTEICFSFDFSERYPEDGNGFFSQIATDDKTWVLFLRVETKEQSKQWMHTHSPNKPKKYNILCLSPRKLLRTFFWDRKGVLMVKFRQQETTTTSEVYC